MDVPPPLTKTETVQPKSTFFSSQTGFCPPSDANHAFQPKKALSN